MAQVVADMFNVKPVRPTGQAGCLLDARARSQLIKAITSALVNLPLFRPGSDVRRRRGPKYIRAAASVRPSVDARILGPRHATPTRPGSRLRSGRLLSACEQLRRLRGSAAGPAVFYRAF